VLLLLSDVQDVAAAPGLLLASPAIHGAAAQAMAANRFHTIRHPPITPAVDMPLAAAPPVNLCILLHRCIVLHFACSMPVHALLASSAIHSQPPLPCT
jgi:hypothetical protein